MYKINIAEIFAVIDAMLDAVKAIDDAEYRAGFFDAMGKAKGIILESAKNDADEDPAESAPMSDEISNCEHVHREESKHQTKCLDCGADLPHTPNDTPPTA